MNNICLYSLILVSFILSGCQKEEKIEYIELYNQIDGYDDNNEQWKSITEDAILMLNKEEILDFNGKYFESRGISIAFEDFNNGELFIRVPSDDIFEVKAYGVTTIHKKGNILTVNIKQTGTACVDYAEPFDGNAMWVSIIAVDKTYLDDKLEGLLVDMTDKKQ